MKGKSYIQILLLAKKNLIMHYVYIIQERVAFNTSFVGFLGW